MTNAERYRHLAACVVPFTKSGEIDREGLETQVAELAETGLMSGFVVNAHAGEGDSLTYEERMQVVEIVARTAKPRGHLTVAGISPYPDTTEGAIRVSSDSQERGADASLMMAPCWFSWGIDGPLVRRFCEEVLEAVDLPMIFFVMGAYSGVNYTTEIVREVCQIPGVVGVKDTTWATASFEKNLHGVRELDRDVAILTGNDTILFYNFLAGADGTLLIFHTLCPELIVGMFNAVREGNIAHAKELHEKIDRLARVIFEPPMINMVPRMKAALYLSGKLPSMAVRAPLQVPGKDTLKRIQKALEFAEIEVKNG
ncbi:MAG: dihydrodipicolinate synthase family protein [bacterium]|nr:dihydrodipicolinate synthase family protein [bacterium]